MIIDDIFQAMVLFVITLLLFALLLLYIAVVVNLILRWRGRVEREELKLRRIASDILIFSTLPSLENRKDVVLLRTEALSADNAEDNISTSLLLFGRIKALKGELREEEGERLEGLERELSSLLADYERAADLFSRRISSLPVRGIAGLLRVRPALSYRGEEER